MFNENDSLIKPKDFIKLTGITYQTLWNWIRSNKINAVRTPTNKYLINRSELLKLNLIKTKII
jgi:excisionase family DNA binding protein